MNVTLEKSRARLQAKAARTACVIPEAAHFLIKYFPAARFRGNVIAGYYPHGDELDILPLLTALHAQGETLCLPVTGRKGHALTFKQWTPDTLMQRGAYGIMTPKSGNTINPALVLLPLLSFTASGDRLGYGGGFYDRTLAALRAHGEIYACGVAYAGQEAALLPTEPTDQRLDGILTPDGFKDFS